MKHIFPIIFLAFLITSSPLFAENYPPIVKITLSKAIAFIKEKNYTQAAAILSEALQKPQGKHKEIYRLLGNCAVIMGNREQAVQAYQDALKLEQKEPLLWLNLGKVQYELKRYIQAADSFRNAWEMEQPDKRNAEILYYSAGSLLMAGKEKRAIAAFAELFANYPQQIKIEWREQYVQALIEDNQTKKALPLILEIISASSGKKKKQWQEILLAQYVELKMYSQALKMARALTEETPGEPRWWKALTHIQLTLNKMEEALSALITYSYLQPLNQRERALLADLYLETGIPGKAAPLYEQNLKQKYRKNMLQRLIISLHNHDNDNKALKILHSYRQEVEKSATLLQLEAEMYYNQKKFGNAARSYNKAATLKGHHQGQCWLIAGYAAMQNEDFLSAKRYLQKAKKYKKQQESAANMLKTVASLLTIEENKKQLAVKDTNK